MRIGTVCFLRQDNKLLLALIEYSPQLRLWNGIGGWTEEGETPEEAVVREVQEETYLRFDKTRLVKVAELVSEYRLDIFFTDAWEGEMQVKDPTLKKLQWFGINELPMAQMHEETEKWLPQVLNGKLIRVIDGHAQEVKSFDEKKV